MSSRSSVERRKMRRKIAKRRGNRCSFCGKSGKMTLDHRIPLSRGGTWKRGNLQLLCEDCNREKGDKMPWDLSA